MHSQNLRAAHIVAGAGDPAAPDVATRAPPESPIPATAGPRKPFSPDLESAPSKVREAARETRALPGGFVAIHCVLTMI